MWSDTRIKQNCKNRRKSILQSILYHYIYHSTWNFLLCSWSHASGVIYYTKHSSHIGTMVRLCQRRKHTYKYHKSFREIMNCLRICEQGEANYKLRNYLKTASYFGNFVALIACVPTSAGCLFTRFNVLHTVRLFVP